MTGRAGFEPLWRALSQPDYRAYTLGQAFNNIGIWIQRVAAGWLAWTLTESPTWLGLIGFADLCPTLLLGPLAGALADRVSRLRLIRFTQAIVAAHGAALFLLMAADMMTVELLFLVLFSQGVFSSANQPARLALYPSLVGRQNLQAAVAINSLVFNAARFVGPVIAGLLIVRLGIGPAFACAAFFFAIFLVASLWIAERHAEPRVPSGKPLTTDAAEGIRYAVRHPGIGPLLLILVAMSLLARPVAPLLPAVADGIHGQGADGLAWMTAVMGAGAIIGGLLLARRTRVEGLTRIFIGNVVVIGLSLALLALSPWFEGALALCAVVGWGLLVNGVAAQTLLQSCVDGAMRARIMSLYGLIMRGLSAVGALAMGAAAEFVGLATCLVAAGACSLLVALWGWARFSAMRPAVEPSTAGGSE